MNILFLGDIIGAPGRRMLAECLAGLIREEGIHLVIANAENAAGGRGVTPAVAEELFTQGIDVLTSGNHIWDKKEIHDYLDRQSRLLRPANYPGRSPGRGLCLVRGRNGVEAAVINLQGRAHMLPIDCPFRKADEILHALDAQVRVRVVDFHAEITSEKVALGWYLDGRVSAVCGTHTHVPTADTRILPGGTALQCDVGMVGPADAIIGVEKDIVLRRFLTGLPVRMEPATGRSELHAVVIEVDEATGRAVGIHRRLLGQD